MQGLLSDLQDLRRIETKTADETQVVSGVRVFASTLSHYGIGAPRESSPFVSQSQTSGDVTFARVEYAGEYEQVQHEVDTVTDLVATGAAGSGFEILIGGGATQTKQEDDIIEEDFGDASVINLPLTLIILLIALGGLVPRACRWSLRTWAWRWRRASSLSSATWCPCSPRGCR